MPAEWELHRGTILTWPQKMGCSFPPPYNAGIPETYLKLIEVLSNVEEVHINAWDEKELKVIEGLLSESKANLTNIFIHLHPSYEPWARDHGPIFLKNQSNQQIIASDWEYNAWGDKYPPYDLDNLIPSKIADVLSVNHCKMNMVLEGGSIEVNGSGDLITTESCLLNPNRNPNLSRDQIETNLIQGLGISRVHWLKSGIEGDDTDGHIDDLTRFVGKNKILTVIEENADDPNYEILQSNLEQLGRFRGEGNEAFEIKTIPMPSPVIRDGHRLPASYANFYIANEVVILPIFNVSEDEIAKDILKDCFPDRAIIAIDSNPLIWGLGSFHCITQQIPN